MTPTTYSHTETIAAITDFYTFYTHLPYLDPSALAIAPATGWPTINETDFKNRGKTEKVIDLLRHLPYLSHPSIRGGWTIDQGSSCIQHHKGICYTTTLPILNTLPGYVVPIAESTDREGSYLLLDTETGSITTYDILADNVQGNWDEYEQLEDKDKWRAFPKTPVRQFFARWRMLYEKLIWMVAPPVDESHGDGGIYFSRADNFLEENELLKSDGHGDSDIDDEITKGVYEIYKRNGWPGNSFDREACKNELKEYLEDADY